MIYTESSGRVRENLKMKFKLQAGAIRLIWSFTNYGEIEDRSRRKVAKVRGLLRE